MKTTIEVIKLVSVRITILLFTLIVLQSDLLGQWNLSLSTSQELNDNPFRSPIAESELISTFNLGIERELDDFNLLYYGSFSLFNKSVLRNYYWHQLGLYTSNDNSIYGIYAEQRLNRSDFNFYNYIDFTAYMRHSLEMDLFLPTILASVAYKKYDNAPEYDNLFLSAGLNINKGFETKTTFIMQAVFNYKNYVNTGTSSGGQGRGRGVMASTEELPNISTSQFYFNTRVAQSLFENTGLAAFYINRSLLGGSGTWEGSYDYNYSDESDLYDDPVSRNENSFGVELTQILPLNIMLKSGYNYGTRDYPTQGIYTDAENYSVDFDRSDTNSYLFLSLNKSFPIDSNEQSFINVGLSYGILENESNSYWYDYKSNQFLINLNLQF
ncbi:MAG: hypothetical protein KKA84_02965 [Bacteroidetes bacterium]|nr:hypothetical protein [Bacteroidota bacterium]